LLAESGGTYKIELSRWPFHINRQLTKAGPSRAIGGTKIREGKALPIASGALSLNNGEIITANSEAGATSISFEMKLPEGRNQLRAWFKDKDGKDLCGAYYVRIQKM